MKGFIAANERLHKLHQGHIYSLQSKIQDLESDIRRLRSRLWETRFFTALLAGILAALEILRFFI